MAHHRMVVGCAEDKAMLKGEPDKCHMLPVNKKGFAMLPIG